jgi:ribonuclease HI
LRHSCPRAGRCQLHTRSRTSNFRTICKVDCRLQADSAGPASMTCCSFGIVTISCLRAECIKWNRKHDCLYDPTVETLVSTLGPRTVQNAYIAELAAMANALQHLPRRKYHSITLWTRNKAAVITLRNPRQQSGQEHICSIYESIDKLKKRCDKITIVWLPTEEGEELWTQAKEKAKEATRQGTELQTPLPRARSTTLNIARAKRGTTRSLPEKVGKLSKKVDKALPGKHTRTLYNQLTHKEASVLAQLRTGIARLNSYLSLINAAPSDQCACGEARETVQHFLFRCRRWTMHRTEMLQCTETHKSNISFYLGGKTLSDDKNWTPNMKAVRATIRFAIQ